MAKKKKSTAKKSAKKTAKKVSTKVTAKKVGPKESAPRVIKLSDEDKDSLIKEIGMKASVDRDLRILALEKQAYEERVMKTLEKFNSTHAVLNERNKLVAASNKKAVDALAKKHGLENTTFQYNQETGELVVGVSE